MAKGNLPACLKITLEHEGGWSDHHKDPGGATMKGVTLAVFRKYVPGATKSDLRAISDEMVEKIYRVGYWNQLRSDDLPAGLDLAVFDFGVNSGVSRSAKYLQALVGAKQDGVIGPATVAAVEKFDAADLVRKLCAKRLGFVRGLSTWPTFGKGWARRIADIEARGVRMAGATRAELSHAALDAGKLSDRQSSAAVSSGAVGAGGSGGAFEFGDVNIWIVVGIAVAAAVIAALR